MRNNTVRKAGEKIKTNAKHVGNRCHAGRAFVLIALKNGNSSSGLLDIHFLSARLGTRSCLDDVDPSGYHSTQPF